MKTVEKLLKEVAGIQKDLANAHKAIDDYYTGRLLPMMGFGPYAQSNIIAGCNKRLAEIKTELINKYGFNEQDANELTREAPASGDVYEACMSFMKKMGAA